MNISGLVLPYPVSANRYWATRCYRVKGTRNTWRSMTYVTKEAEAYREQVKAIVRAYGVTTPIEGRVTVGIRLYPHRPLDWKLRMRKYGDCWDDTVQCIDAGNCEKVMSDALQGVAISNDALFRKLVIERMEPDGGGKRLVLWVEAIAPRVYQQELLEA